MAFLQKPDKPLKILTLDGCGLQAISQLLILDKLLSTIQSENGAPTKPRPCDVFDTIGGIGAGGWLALLLGRFHLDVTSCLTEWYNLIHCIKPRTNGEVFRRRLFQHSYFDIDHLIEQVGQLTELYGTGKYLFSNDSKQIRCRYVFVAALNADKKLDYNLFRTYECPSNPKQRLLKGPSNPREYLMTRAFAVTGAAKYFSVPWKEQVSNNGRIKFLDTKFPEPHNITELALDEMWGLFGTDVAISVVVNIGPGLPNDSDFKTISRRFSWGLDSPALSRGPSLVGPDRMSLDQSHLDMQPDSSTKALNETNGNKGVRFQAGKALLDDGERDTKENDLFTGHRNVARVTTYGSVVGRPLDEKLRRLESDIEKDIKKKLKAKYPKDTPPYYRLAPNNSPKGTAQNDASAPGLALDATQKFLATSTLRDILSESVRMLIAH